jgi:hypothetical protein
MDAPDPAPASRTDRTTSLSDLGPRIGERLQLLLPRYAPGRAYVSKLIGWSEGEFVIVRRPADSDGPVPLVVGDAVTVRVFTGTDVAEFASSVQRLFTGGVPYVHLDFPSAVRAQRLRAESRVAVDLPALAVVDGRDGPVEVRVRDLSLRGARLQVQQPIGAPGTRVTLRIAVEPAEGAAPAVDLPAEVRSSRPLAANAPDGPCVCGVQFGPLDEARQGFVRRATGRAG